MAIKFTLQAISDFCDKLILSGRTNAAFAQDAQGAVSAKSDRLFLNHVPIFRLPLRKRRRFSIKHYLKSPWVTAMSLVVALTLFSGKAFAAIWRVNSVTGIGAQGGSANYGSTGAATFVITFTTSSPGGGTTNPDNLTLAWTGTVPVGVTLTPATFTPAGGTTVTVTFNTTAATTQIGSYPFKITIGDTNGGAGGSITGTLVVSKAPLTITATSQSYVYGSVTIAFAYTITGYVNGDTQATTMQVLPTVTASPAVTTSSNAGTYTLTPSGAVTNQSYYTINYVTGTFTITKAPVIISATGPSKAAGSTLASLTNTPYYFTVTGLKGTDSVSTVNLTVNPTTSQTAGSTYTVTPSGAIGTGGFNTTNYSISYVAYGGTVGNNYTWNGSSSNAWNTAANWTPNGVPGPNDNITIPTGTTYQPVISTTPININFMQFTGSGNASLTISSGDFVTIYNGFTNAAGVTVNMIMGSNTAELAIGTTSSHAILTNSGTFNMAGGKLYITYGLNYIYNEGTMTLNGGNTFEIGGTSGQLAFENNGTFYAGTSNSTCTMQIEHSQSMVNDAAGSFYLGSTSSITFLDAASHDSHFSNKNGGNFVLQSDQYGSATIGAIPLNATRPNSFDGTFTAERYLSAHRGYRLLASPVYAATSGSNKVYSLNYVQGSAYISGTSATGGFDKVSQGPTLYLYREDVTVSNATFISGNYQSINNLNNGYNSTPTYTFDVTSGSYSIPNTNGFLFFFRGDRFSSTYSMAQEFTPGNPAEAVTMTTNGSLGQQQYTFRDWYTPSSANLGYSNPNVAAQGFNLAGNPYPSSIDWESYQTTTTGTGIYATNLNSTVYELNPITQNYDTYQKGGTYTNSGTRTIASGQGFFVLANNASATLQLNESCKTNTLNTGTTLFMGTPADRLALREIRIQMRMDSINTDDMVLNFRDDAKAAYDFQEDAPYRIGNGKVSMASISADNVALAINKLPFVIKGQTIGLKVGALADGTYSLNLKDIKGIPHLFAVWVRDNYLKDSTNLSKGPYTFSIAKADTNSFGSKRFVLVIKQDPAYAYHLLDFRARRHPDVRQVDVTWDTQYEGNYTNFTVERSIDGGKTFTILGSITAADASTYGITDKTPVDGMNLYRLKQEDINNQITYSAIVPVGFSGLSNSLSKNGVNIFPNPATGVVNMSVLNNFNTSSSYNFMITNTSGKTLKQGASALPYWQYDVTDWMPGTYFVKIFDSKTQALVGTTKLVKL